MTDSFALDVRIRTRYTTADAESGDDGFDSSGQFSRRAGRGACFFSSPATTV